MGVSDFFDTPIFVHFFRMSLPTLIEYSMRRATFYFWPPSFL